MGHGYVLTRRLLVATSVLLGGTACEAILGLQTTHADGSRGAVIAGAGGQSGRGVTTAFGAAGTHGGATADETAGESAGAVPTAGADAENPAQNAGASRGGAGGTASSSQSGDAGTASPSRGGSAAPGAGDGDAGEVSVTGGGATDEAGHGGGAGQATVGESCGATVCGAGVTCVREQACLDTRWASWPMPNPNAPAAPGVSGDTSSLPHASSYDTASSGVVEDGVTGLIWQADVAGPFASEDAAGYCATLELGGYDDFRLPTRVELFSLVDFTRHDPAIDTDAFPSTPAAAFWTASVVAGEASSSFGVSFALGVIDVYPQTSTLEVRCVR